MDSTIDLDEVYRALGVTRKYALYQMGISMFTIIPCSIILMAYVFIGYRPAYWCADVEPKYVYTRMAGSLFEEQNQTYSLYYGKCQVTLSWNQSNITHEESFNCPNGYKYDIPTDRSFVTEWDLVCDGAERSELSQSLLLLGQAAGAMIFTQISDKVGRKPVMAASNICIFLISLALAFVPYFTVFMILRFFIGMMQQGVGLCCACIYLELLPSEYRYLGEIVGLTFWTTGVVLVAPVAYLLQHYSWRYTQLAFALVSCYSLFHYWIVDESVRWLLANGKTKEAEKIIRKACRWNKKNFDDVINRARVKSSREESLKLIKADSVEKIYELDIKTEEEAKQCPETDVQANGETKQYRNGDPGASVEKTCQNSKDSTGVKAYSFIDIFKNRHVLFISCICAFTWITNSLTYYGLMMVSSTLSGNRFLNFFLLAVVEYPSAFAELLLIRRYGRRWACVTLHAIAGVALLISCILNIYKEISGLGTLSTVFSLIGKFGITGSFSTIFLFTPELYPTNMRSAGLGFSSTFARVGGILAPFAGTLAEHVEWGPGVVFSVMCLVTSVLVLFLPETTGRTLPTTIEELNLWYKDHTGVLHRKKRTGNKV